MNHREPLKLPVRHNGCVKDAVGVKYVSIACRCTLGGAVHSVVITPAMSFTGSSISGLLDVFSEQPKLFRERQIALPVVLL